MVTSYAEINSLGEISFIGGHEQILDFTVYDVAGSLIDLNAATIIWRVGYYGQPNTIILQKTGVVTGLGTFTITLDEVDTLSLSGKFSFQPVIIDFNGDTFRPGQGVMTIIPAIQTA